MGHNKMEAGACWYETVEVRHFTVGVSVGMPGAHGATGPHSPDHYAEIINVPWIALPTWDGQNVHDAAAVKKRLRKDLVGVEIRASGRPDDLTDVVNSRGAGFLVSGKDAQIRHRPVLPDESTRTRRADHLSGIVDVRTKCETIAQMSNVREVTVLPKKGC